MIGRNGVTKIVFVPYAAHDHDAYEKKVKGAFSEFGTEFNFILSLMFFIAMTSFVNS